MNWIDRLVSYVSPSTGLRRTRARLASELLARHYEAAAHSRRTQGWRSTGADANAVNGPALAVLRERARELVRNNAYAESALGTIADHTVGTGVVAKPVRLAAATPRNQRDDPKITATRALWRDWAETVACDADGRNDLAGLQKLVTRTVVESGECLVRRRWRRPEDGLPVPLQLQVLDPDLIDTAKTGLVLSNGGRIIHGVEFDALGKRAAYWLFREHPGSDMLAMASLQSYRIPADGVLHIYRQNRPGQVRGITWFAPVLLPMRDLDDYQDATLMKQKVAACLAVLTTSPDGTPALGTADDTKSPRVDSLEPGMIVDLPQGSDIHVVQPPQVTDYPAFSKDQLRKIATGIGVAYEDLTGDYTGMPFSAARMSRLRHWARVEDWRWRILIPQFCQPVWDWFQLAAAVMGAESAAVEWTAPPPPMVDPSNEGLAYQRNIRTGLMSLSEALRERGYDPDDMLAEIAADAAKLDELGLTLDCDPRRVTQAGNPVQGDGGAATGAIVPADQEHNQ